MPSFYSEAVPRSSRRKKCLEGNAFGKLKTNMDFQAISGDGFKISVHSKWNPSKEKENPSTVLRFENSFNATSNVLVPTEKKAIKHYGASEEFLSKADYRLGKQFYFGKTYSERKEALLKEIEERLIHLLSKGAKKEIEDYTLFDNIPSKTSIRNSVEAPDEKEMRELGFFEFFPTEVTVEPMIVHSKMKLKLKVNGTGVFIPRLSTHSAPVTSSQAT